jgi:hypothetical protein
MPTAFSFYLEGDIKLPDFISTRRDLATGLFYMEVYSPFRKGIKFPSYLIKITG